MAKQELIIGNRQAARSQDRSADNQALIVKGRQVSVTEQALVPTLIENAGRKAKRKFVEFFTTKIENDNTRAAYAEAVDRFLHWCTTQGLSIETIEPTLVALYFKKHCPETRPYKAYSKPTLTAKSTKKQHLAAVRQMFDHLTSSGVIEFNPAASVKGPTDSAADSFWNLVPGAGWHLPLRGYGRLSPRPPRRPGGGRYRAPADPDRGRRAAGPPSADPSHGT